MRVLILFLLLTRVAVADQVTVYTLSTLPVTSSTPVDQVLMDESELILAELGIDLPNHQDAAHEAVTQRLETPEGRTLVKQLGASMNGVMEAWAHGINRLPAIVINDQYLIYGVYNVDDALAIFRNSTR